MAVGKPSKTKVFYKAPPQYVAVTAGWWERLNDAATAKNMSLRKAGLSVGVPYGTVQSNSERMRDGNFLPSLDFIIPMATAVGVDWVWILTGQGLVKASPLAQRYSSSTARMMPVFELAEIGCDDLSVLEVRCVVPIDARLGTNIVAGQLTERAMSPQFPTGTVVIADHEETAEPGDLVLVTIAEYGKTFLRNYQVDEHNGKLLHRFTPIASGFRSFSFSDNDGWEVYGVVLQTLVPTHEHGRIQAVAK